MASRYDAVIQLGLALDHLDQVLEMLNQMGATYSMCDRLRTKINQLTDLRVDVMQADLPQEGE